MLFLRLWIFKDILLVIWLVLPLLGLLFVVLVGHDDDVRGDARVLGRRGRSHVGRN